MAEIQAPPPLPKSQPSFGRRHSTIIKLLGVGALILVLLIPLAMITGVLSDRLRRAQRRGAEVPLKDFRKDIILELYNEAGQLVFAYKIYRCWVSEYQILPDLDANANAITIEQIKLENEGWERDQSIKEPVEPSSKKS